MRRRSLFGLLAGAAAAPVVATLPKAVVAAPAAVAGKSYVDILGVSLNSASYPWTVADCDYRKVWYRVGRQLAREADARWPSTVPASMSPILDSATTAPRAALSAISCSRPAARLLINRSPSMAPRSSSVKTRALSATAMPSSSASFGFMSAPRDDWGSVSVLGNGRNGKLAA